MMILIEALLTLLFLPVIAIALLVSLIAAPLAQLFNLPTFALSAWLMYSASWMFSNASEPNATIGTIVDKLITNDVPYAMMGLAGLLLVVSFSLRTKED